MRRHLTLGIATIAALATITPFSVTAQSNPPAAHAVDRSLPWCAAPATKPEWARQPIYLVLEEERDAPTVASNSKRLPPPHLNELLDAVRTQYRAATERSDRADENGTSLSAADSRYGVSALWGEIAFQLRGNGVIDSVVLRDVRDSTLFNQLAAALRAGSGPGALTPFGIVSDVRQMTLKPAMNASKKGASWAMFTMDVPRERPAVVAKRPSLSYPPAMLNWKAEITLQFYVDTAGKPEPRTIVTVPLVESIKWPDDESRQAFQAFLAVARRGVERTRFTPAEFLGCRYRRLVSQPLVFEPRPPL